jgi:hypothetical protein
MNRISKAAPRGCSAIQLGKSAKTNQMKRIVIERTIELAKKDAAQPARRTVESGSGAAVSTAA